MEGYEPREWDHVVAKSKQLRVPHRAECAAGRGRFALPLYSGFVSYKINAFNNGVIGAFSVITISALRKSSLSQVFSVWTKINCGHKFALELDGA